MEFTYFKGKTNSVSLVLAAKGCLANTTTSSAILVADWATTGVGAGLKGRPRMSDTWRRRFGLSTLTEVGPEIEMDTGDTLLLESDMAASSSAEIPGKTKIF